MPNSNLYIIDDGTLDTIVACAACDWEGRYNPECALYPPADCAIHGEDWRVNAALEMAAEDHDCGTGDVPLN